MTTHQIGDRFQFSTNDKYAIILGYNGYGLQEVATGRNPLWWDADNFIGGFSTLEHAEIAVRWLNDPGDHFELQQDLFDLKGI
jgi:hypothetical protein